MRNFGIVSATERYQIYRSAELGSHGLAELKEALDQANLPFPKTIIYMNSAGYAFPLYFALEEYKAQEEYGFRFFHPFGTPRTYVDGYNPYHPTDVIDKRTILGHFARKYFAYGDGNVCGGVEAVILILNLILDPSNQPVLFHCLGGMNRTGMIAMIIRYMQKMPWDKILAEYHQHAKPFARQENIDFVLEFIKSPAFMKLCDVYSFLLNN